jgi:hypothetical protein
MASRNTTFVYDKSIYDHIWQNLRRARGLDPELTDTEADGAVAILMRSQAPSGVITNRLWSHRLPRPELVLDVPSVAEAVSEAA